MISSYRLGDLVILGLSENEENELLQEHPNSIGGEFILEKRKNSSISKIDLITQIVLNRINKNAKLLPDDIVNSTVVHLRLGDVVAGNQGHELGKRPFDISFIKSQLVDDDNKKYIIGKCFFAKPSSTNYEECIRLSNTYLQNVVTELEAEHINNDDADIDLCCAVSSKVFLQGRGFFSKLIVEIRKKLNLINIETSVHD